MFTKVLINKKTIESAPMNDKNFFISKPAFNELCKYVCYQIEPSGSEQLDRETLNFAIYWQICCLLNEQVEFVTGLIPKTVFYQQLLQSTLDSRMAEPFDVSEIINKNISELFQEQYPESNNFNGQSESSDVWMEQVSYC